MKQDEIKLLVSEHLNNGQSLSDIQKLLKNDHDITMTFLDLRLLAAELEEIDWSKQKADIQADKEKKKAEEDKIKEKEQEATEVGKTVVKVDKVKRPGSMANGTVKFASGASAEWILDQTGRLALDNQSGEPTPDDVQEFQVELQSILQGSM